MNSETIFPVFQLKLAVSNCGLIFGMRGTKTEKSDSVRSTIFKRRCNNCCIMNSAIMDEHIPTIPSRLFNPDTLNVDDFKKICARTIDPATYPLAQTIKYNVPVYDLSSIEAKPPTTSTIAHLQDEWHHILHTGPGVFILKNLYHPARYAKTLTSTNAAFDRIIAKERTTPTTSNKGDHFATSGTNDRIWNAFQKHALEDSNSFIDYYSNPWLATICTAWLGPAYKITAQVNAVHPGGAAQDPHRDYHLGFQEIDTCARYPVSTHWTSQFLTLQGAVAHTDMPGESGPTRFLPFSQTYAPGYLAWRRDEFRSFFQEKYIAVPLALGDGVFFNPAVFHAAGANTMDASNGGFRRVANLLQISSAFGKPMESVDSLSVVDCTWKGLVKRFRDEAGSRIAGVEMDVERESRGAREVRAFVQAVAEGYAFPTNLDCRPPKPSGMAPESEQDVLVRGLEGGWGREEIVGVLERMRMESRA